MNPILELRWKIAMLEMARTSVGVTYNAEMSNRVDRVIHDLHVELATQEQFAAQSKIDAERTRRIDMEKAKL